MSDQNTVQEHKTVFISYRRSVASFIARAVFMDLCEHGYDVFMDVENIDSGHFDKIILNQIAARAHFVLILAPGTVERCSEPDDWLRREIEYALDNQRNIVSLFVNGFTFNGTDQYLTGKLSELRHFNGLNVPHDFFEEAMERLRSRFLKQPTYGDITPAPVEDQAVVEQKIEQVSQVAAPVISPDTLPRTPQYADSQLSMLQALDVQWQAEGTPSAVWREAGFSVQLDTVIAQMATAETREVAEKAARLIGRIRSETAVCQIAEAYQRGQPRTIRALAWVIDEAKPLPDCVGRVARLRAWLANTWLLISGNADGLNRRFSIAVLFGSLSIGLYTYFATAGSSASGTLYFTERLGKMLSNGLTLGIAVGFTVIFAAEVPERLRHFWAAWLRLLWSFAFGFGFGILTWLIFYVFFLYYVPQQDDYDAFIVGGIGFGIAFALRSTLRVPAWVATIWAALAIGLTIYIAWVNEMPPLIYTRPGESIVPYAILVAGLIAMGAYGEGLFRQARHVWRRLRHS